MRAHSRFAKYEMPYNRMRRHKTYDIQAKRKVRGCFHVQIRIHSMGYGNDHPMQYICVELFHFRSQ